MIHSTLHKVYINYGNGEIRLATESPLTDESINNLANLTIDRTILRVYFQTVKKAPRDVSHFISNNASGVRSRLRLVSAVLDHAIEVGRRAFCIAGKISAEY